MGEEPVFLRDGDLFVPTERAGSPWGPGVLHGGPPAGLLARAIERANSDPELQVARLTIDLLRPVPKAPLAATARVVREGKRIAVLEASLLSGGVEVSRATALLLRRSKVALPQQVLPPPRWVASHETLPTVSMGEALAHNLPPEERQRQSTRYPGFHTTVEVRRVDGEPGRGRGTAWIRIPVPFVEGEATSPLVRLAATSDFGNALGHIRPDEQVGFINADISLHLHRMPEGEWICLETKATAQEYGIGLVESVVHDLHGPIGRVSQAILVNRR